MIQSAAQSAAKRSAIAALHGASASVAANKPAIIHVKTDPEALTSRITLTQLREQSLSKQKG